MDAQIARHRAARLVEFLLQLAEKPRNIFDGWMCLGVPIAAFIS